MTLLVLWLDMGFGLRGPAGTGKDDRKTLLPMQPDSNLESLMVSYQHGDLAAASALVHSVSPRLHRFFAAQASSRAHADDLLQETWLRIHSARHTWRPGEPALPWFYAIARHVRVDHYRKSVRSAAGERELEARSRLAASAPGSGPDELGALLAPLSASEREAVEMLKVAGMSLEEVARATSSTVGAVKQRAHRAYRKLRETMSSMALRKTKAED
jgi:RNA polymerase sigma-70 factor (ECF subfamily)